MRIIIFCAMLVFITDVYGQGGNLQFNQALFVQMEQAVNANEMEAVIGSITVPEGKVWKIERASLIGNFPCGVGITSYTNMSSLTTIGNLVVVQGGAYEGLFPIWLPSGTYPINVYGVGNCIEYDYNLKFVYSGIEFNVTQ